MNLTEQNVNAINQINLIDSLNASLLKLLIKCTDSTTIPNTNDLIIYVDTQSSDNPTNLRKTYQFELSNVLRHYNQTSDEFLLYFDIKDNDIVMKAKVSRKIEYNSETQTYNVLTDTIIEELEGFPIILFEGINYIYTNYTNADLTIIYPKNTELNKLLINSAIYYNHKLKNDNEFSLDDIYFKDCFTKTDNKYNLEIDNLKLDCLTSKNNKFSLDSNGNLIVNSIYNLDGNVKLKDLFNYSSSETPIGNWIDGKAIYRKVITFTPTSQDYTYYHNIQNIKEILPMSSAIFHRVDGQFVPLSLYYYLEADVWGVGCQFTKNKIDVWMGNKMFAQMNSSSSYAIAITLYYTKES